MRDAKALIDDLASHFRTNDVLDEGDGDAIFQHDSSAALTFLDELISQARLISTHRPDLLVREASSGR